MSYEKQTTYHSSIYNNLRKDISAVLNGRRDIGLYD
jgi:hypothetical protein